MAVDESAADVATELLAELIEAEKAYRAGAPVMSDDEFDALRDQLADVGQGREDVDSFLESVAGGVEGGDVAHATPMLSLDKITTDAELEKFLVSVQPSTVFVSPKLDGVALSVLYRDGALADLVTRGNGREGHSVFHNRDLVAGLPERLEVDGAPSPITELEVRGEVVMTTEDLAEASANRGTPFANRRNPIGPTLHQATKDRTYRSPMRFVAYSLAAPMGESLADDLAQLSALGFSSVAESPSLADLCSFVEAVDDVLPLTAVKGTVDAIGESMANTEFDFLLDGAVITADDKATRDRLGETGSKPRWASAFKFPSETAIGVLSHIETALGKTGAISYTAVLEEPVALAGTMVQRASVHNPSIIAKLDLHLGDTVVVTKKNEIIPQIISVDTSKRSPEATPYEAPTTCPNCDEPLDFSAGRPKCLSPSCSLASRLTAAAGRNGFDWDGVSGSAIGKAIDAGLAKDLADLFVMQAEDWETLEGITGSASKIADTIHGSLTTTRLDQVLGSLGVRFVNRTFARRLAAHYETLEAVRAASIDGLQVVEGIGEDRATAIHDGLAELAPVLDRLVDLGLVPLEVEKVEVADGAPFTGHKVLVTGTVEGMNRDAAKEAVRKLGGDPASSVSKKTTIYVVAEGAGPAKVDKIDALVESDPETYQKLTAEEFLELLGEA